MQQFIPFEDDWDALEKMCPEILIPYRVGLVPAHEPSPGQAGGVFGPNAHQAGHASPLTTVPPGKNS